MNDLLPWINNDMAGQEQVGYTDGQLHCKQGWCTDNSCDDSGMTTPYLTGYRRGWDQAKADGLHGTEPIQRATGPLYISPEAVEEITSWANSISEEDRRFILGK